MSFRSRSRTVQPVTIRRSLSGSRLPSSVSMPTSYSNSRPLSSAYPSSYTAQNYISPYSSSTRDSIYSSPSSRSSYYNGGTANRRDSYGGSSTIYKNPYADRYVSPYKSYENGITTAGLNIKSSYGNNGYSGKGTYTSVYANNNKPSSSRHSTNLLSASNTSLNSYSSIPLSSSVSSSCIGRSQSFKDHDRKSRSLRRNASLKSARSLSVSSEKSEGYEVRVNA